MQKLGQIVKRKQCDVLSRGLQALSAAAPGKLLTLGTRRDCALFMLSAWLLPQGTREIQLWRTAAVPIHLGFPIRALRSFTIICFTTKQQ